ncbi:MAG TPA: hypothetical protein VG820_13460 [Fimbriimonadaceae bacterium]|nr:hypothetical protein [Fimbriimonadaceae bacterium]
MVALCLALIVAAQNPRWEWHSTQGSLLSLAKDPARPYLYAARNEGGVAVLDAELGRQIALVPKKDLGGLDATTLLQRGDSLYVALGNFFNPRGSKYGVARVDVSHPDRPRVVDLFESGSKERGASGLAARGDTLAMGLMSRGLAIFDTSGAAIRLLTTFKPDPDYPVRKPKEPHVPNARGLAFDGNILYVAYDAGGLRVIDLADPVHPREVGRYLQEGMKKKQQAYNNLVVDGPLAYVAVDYAGVEIVDISDPEHIKQVSWWNPWHAERPGNVWFNSKGHASQLVFDKARNTLYVAAGDSDMVALDVSDPAHPRQTGSFGRPGDGLGTWGIEMSPGRLYLSYILAAVPFRGTWAGIKALTIP